MKIKNSLRALRNRHRNNRVVRRRGRLYVINKTNRRYKGPPGLNASRANRPSVCRMSFDGAAAPGVHAEYPGQPFSGADACWPPGGGTRSKRRAMSSNPPKWRRVVRRRLLGGDGVGA